MLPLASSGARLSLILAYWQSVDLGDGANGSTGR